MRSVLLPLVLLAACAAPPPARTRSHADEPPVLAVAPVASSQVIASTGASVAPIGRATRIDLDVEDMDLVQVMDLIGRQVGTNILVDPAVHERVTISLRDVPWRDAVDLIARRAGCDVEER